MTRNEFDVKFEQAYKRAIKSFDDMHIVQVIMDKHLNDNGKLSQDELGKGIIEISALLISVVLKDVLLEILPLEE